MSEKPLHNVVISCTSVTQDERSSIMRKALEMGAIVQADLTSDVTHLIVAKLQTEKYRFAARHRTDLKLMTVDWVPAVHAIWITGRDVNLPWSEDKYRLSIFHGLKICVTNLEIELRGQIEQLVTQHGAHYSGDLTKENTHLIAGSASGKKWEAVHAWQCDISIVGVEWVYESIKRGAALEEKFFGLELSPEVRGQTSWFPPKIVPQESMLEGSLSPTASAKRKRPLLPSHARKRLSKRASTLSTDGLWAEILKTEDTTENSEFTPPTAATTEPHFAGFSKRSESANHVSTTDLLPADMTCGIFEHQSFHIAGFAPRENAIVHRTLESNGAKIVNSPNLADLIVVPQNGSPPQFPNSRADVVTEFWLERCLALHRFEDPRHSFTSAPFSCSLPIARMEQLSICISGFPAVESMHIEKLIKMVGAIHCETLTKGRSILLAASRDCRKFRAAKDNGTRVVKVEWLWDCIARGKMIGVTEYALDGVIGSQCRIDGNVALRQRRSVLLTGKVCYISHQTANYSNLCKMAETMGARITSSLQDPSLTHIVGNSSADNFADESNAYRVSPAWLSETFALLNRQLESAYPPQAIVNDENTPPTTDTDDGKRTNNHQKLVSEVHALRKRINSNNSRKSPRKILGRAATLPQISDLSMMMSTNEEETISVHEQQHEQRQQQPRHQEPAQQTQSSTSQGVTYSDPEVVEKQRELMLKLGAVRRELSSSSSLGDWRADGTSSRGSMRAVGLDDVRKLRR